MAYIKGAGTILQDYREKRGISRTELAKKLNIHPNTAYNWEQGKSRIDLMHLMQIAKELDIPAEVINNLTRTEAMKEDTEASLETGIRVGDSSADDFVNMLNKARQENMKMTEIEKNDISRKERNYMKDFKLIKADEVFEHLYRHEHVLALTVYITPKDEFGWKTFEMRTSSVEKVLETIEDPNAIFIVKK